MNHYNIVKLKFLSPLHVGRGLGEAYDMAERTLHSDTVSGALTAVFCELFPGEDPLDFMNKYRVSSAFPYYDQHYFLPRPLTKMNLSLSGIEEYTQKKKLKKIEYIEIPLWQRMFSGEPIQVAEENLSKNGKFLFNGKAPEEVPYKDEVQQRVAVPGNGENSKPYYLERRFFSQKAGLYFFLDAAEELNEKMKTILNYLGDMGFGTDKSVGNGQFEHKTASLELEMYGNFTKQMLISLVCPAQEEISVEMLTAASYQLVQRGGFIAGTSVNQFRHLRKKSVYMFTEGSVFPAGNLFGKIENVRPEWNDDRLHPVYRDGRAFVLPFKL